ncbi:hypothetical protein EYW49_22640 [Siculibacillus lacustris]|uniref:VPLPA-CTERM sorting domain-containing protein n=1 Tax=Siculibacillus lacustris TaxID=1549641 RepID=A0A4Q9VCE3_9HYPH|nr:hypothetical protein [Siculibacillus lacustris]TBW32117.1 hypothetical protein EYW49_22640 [Siculibacillus lacustris]
MSKMSFWKAAVVGATLAIGMGAPAANAAAPATVSDYLGIQANYGNLFISNLTSYSSFLSGLQSALSSSLGYAGVNAYFNNTPSLVDGSTPTHSVWFATLTFTGTSVISNGSIVNLSTGAVSSVPAPGPIAGAGLPILVAMLGFGLYHRRRVA